MVRYIALMLAAALTVATAAPVFAACQEVDPTIIKIAASGVQLFGTAPTITAFTGPELVDLKDAVLPNIVDQLPPTTMIALAEADSITLLVIEKAEHNLLLFAKGKCAIGGVAIDQPQLKALRMAINRHRT